ncbi:hypothetical protein G3O01_02285 [Burkholderia sp. Ac-20365]|nr:hypothetical protein [Burkholderia sp. Ac-20365]
MRTLALPRFRPFYTIAACSVVLAATCAYQAPGMMQAILVVGANAQLPLERLAADAGKPEAVSSTAVSVQVRPAVDVARPARERHPRRDVHGYERGVTDYKYWT